MSINILRLSCAMVLLCGPIFSQSVTGNIIGTVTDSSLAAVPGAEVQIRDAATGAFRTASSGAEGIIRFTNPRDPRKMAMTLRFQF